MKPDFKNKHCKLYFGDCLEVMQSLKSESIDLILNDPPYGFLKRKWDKFLDPDKVFEQYLRLVKTDTTPMVLFANLKSALQLMQSQEKLFRYELIWNKKVCGNSFILAKKQPMITHEYILVFAKRIAQYFPVMEKGTPYKSKEHPKDIDSFGVKVTTAISNNGTRYPKSIIEFRKDITRRCVHHTQKPIQLMEYLIRTYSKPGDIILDNTMGSGTTGVACINTGRKFIGIENSKEFFDIAVERIKNTQTPLLLNKDEQ